MAVSTSVVFTTKDWVLLFAGITSTVDGLGVAIEADCTWLIKRYTITPPAMAPNSADPPMMIIARMNKSSLFQDMKYLRRDLYNFSKILLKYIQRMFRKY
jgi:hypothetical protein